MMVAAALEGAAADAAPRECSDAGSRRQRGSRPGEADITTRSPSLESQEESHADTPQRAVSRKRRGDAPGVAMGARVDNSDTTSVEDQPISLRMPRIRGRVVMSALALAVVLIASLSVAPEGLSRWAAAQRPQPTTTAKPTATATTAPTPAVMPGFALYSDPSAGYSLQYPRTWSTTPGDAPLDVEFAAPDPTNSGPSAYFTIWRPDPKNSGVAAQADDNSTAAAWVDFMLSGMQQKVIGNGGTLQRVPGPIPAVTIANQIWQNGIANISYGQTLSARLQLYATMHAGKPYVIAVYALTDAFQAGSQQYFTPMLNSFKFLPPAA